MSTAKLFNLIAWALVLVAGIGLLNGWPYTTEGWLFIGAGISGILSKLTA